MIVLNECRIDPEKGKLIIEASVDTLSYYKCIYIDSVVIDTEETYVPSGPSNNPVFTKTYESDYMKVDVRNDCNSVTTTEECKCGNVYTSEKAGRKKISLCLSAKDLNKVNLDNNIFFVYVIATGTPDPCTPCGMDNTFVMGIAVNLRPIYNRAMKYIKELD